MSTKTHDEMIKTAVRWALSLGYGVLDSNLGTETGADAIFQNRWGEKAILEVVTGASFRTLFKKPRIRKALEIKIEGYIDEDIVWGIIVVGDRIDHVKDHGVELGLSEDLFESGSKNQRVFSVLARDFKEVIPVLLVSLLGSRASALARVW